MKILIVEDEKELSDSILTYLKKEKYLCETAANFSEALEKIWMDRAVHFLPGILPQHL